MTLITSSSQLSEYCKKLENEKYITVDTEFLRDKTYYPMLCLVQVASEQIEFAVDPLIDGIDLSPLFELFQNKNIVKVFHSARQDIEIILKLSGCVPVPLFDTQVAAMVCGFGSSVSYANLVNDIVGKTVDKSSRFTDWSRRPLSDRQLDYALSDVTFLRDVYIKLKAELENEKRGSWLDEEMESLTNPDNYYVDPDEAWRKLKPRGSSRRFLGIIKELAKWRELKAQKLNKPKTFILKDTVLMEIAAVCPRDLKGLQSIRGVGGLKKEMEIEIIEAIDRANKTAEKDLPEKIKHNKLLNNNGSLIDLFKVLLKAKCEEANVAEKLVATNEDLNKLAINCDPDIKVLQGWRFKVFGKYALDLKEGKVSLSVKNGNIEIVDR